MKYFKFLVCISFLFTASCEEGVDIATENILYPFAYADFRNTVPDEPPVGLKQVFLETTDSNGESMSIHAWYGHTHSKQKGRTLVYFHGNNENLKMLEKRGAYERFRSLGFNFVVIDYPGLGKSTSFPNEHNMKQAGLAAFEFALNEFPNTEMILWGRSLGAAVASQIAPLVQHHLTAFVLTSPWANFKDLAHSRSGLARNISEDWLLEHTYDSEAAAKKMRVPSLVQHGKKDKVIPFKFGKRVYEAFPKGMAEFHEYPRLGHRDIFRTEKVWQAAEQFLQQL